MSLRRSRRGRRPVLLSLLLACAMAMAAYAGVVAIMGSAAADPAPSEAGVRLVSTGTGGEAAEGGQNPAVSADGRHVVFQSKADLPALSPLHARVEGSGTWRIYSRDRAIGITTLLSDPTVDSTEPSVSADGRRVAYRIVTRLVDGLAQASTVVVDRDVSGRGRLDTAGNVSAADFADASPELAESFPGLCATECGPQISADGSTVVYPSVASAVSPSFVVLASKDGNTGLASVNGVLIDINEISGRVGFGRDDEPISIVVATKSVVPGQETTDFTGRLSVQNPYGGLPWNSPAFSIGPKTCDTSGTCRSTLTFDPSRGCTPEGRGQRWDRLVIDGPTSAGHASVVLKADCGPNAGRAFCGPQPGSDGFYDAGLSSADLARLPVRIGHPTPSQASGNQISLGGQAAGQAFLLAVPTEGLSGTVDFGTLDCDPFRLVDPGPEARAKAAKLTGADPTAVPLRARLDGTDRGTLYVLVNPPFLPPSVRYNGSVPNREPVYAAQLRMTADDRGPGHGSFAMSVFSARQIIESRRDATDSGGFTPGRAELVSRGVFGHGYVDTELVDGTHPSVSADGRTVAYTRHAHPDAAVNQPAVVVTTRDADGTWSRESLVPAPLDTRYSTDAPSLSADGGTVAYVRSPDPMTAGQSAQIAVTHLNSRGTVRTVSTNASGTPGDGDSGSPTLSPDGRVVGFVSKARTLTTDEAGTGPQLYLRTVADPQGIARIAPADVASSAIGLDERGTLAVFATTTPLLTTDTGARADVYARETPGQLTVRPTTIDFGAFRRPSTTSLGIQVTLGNPGPGAVSIGAAVPATPFGYRSTCVGRTLTAGETCAGVVSFTPGVPGVHTGLLRIEARTSGGDTGLTAEADLKAQVADPPPTPSPSENPPPTTQGPPPTSSPSPPPTSSPIPPPSGPESPSPPPDSSSPPGPPHRSAAALHPSPTVARPGRVLAITGAGFAPGARISLTWGSAGPVEPITVGPDGTFRAYVDVPSSQPVGRRVAITAADAQGALLAYTDLLVDVPSLQAPSFQNRS
ncbi:hypothetical protein ACIQUL_34225 [Streptomyces sp. NPDC090303]|uniref:hypothetical protein n=1 Tax=Streptomyces sp. NPDC090303 TaxID=3365960 RepID=UPI0038040A8D